MTRILRVLIIYFFNLHEVLGPRKLFQGILSVERDITFPIKAGAEECFFETALIGQILDIDYQVVDSSSDGNYHIDFKIERPDGRLVVMDTDKVENTQQVHNLF